MEKKSLVFVINGCIMNNVHNGSVLCMNKNERFWLSVLEGFQICKIKKLGMTLAKQSVP